MLADSPNWNDFSDQTQMTKSSDMIVNVSTSTEIVSVGHQQDFTLLKLEVKASESLVKHFSHNNL